MTSAIVILAALFVAIMFVVVQTKKVKRDKKSTETLPEVTARDLADPRVAALYNTLSNGRPAVTGWSAGVKTLLFIGGFLTAGILWVPLLVQTVSTGRQKRAAVVYDGQAYQEVQRMIREIST
jgi:hypothetical protein